MQKVKRKSLCAAFLAVILCAVFALSAFSANDVLTAKLTKGNASAYGGVIKCRQVAFWGESYNDSNQDMRLMIKKKTFGVWYSDYDKTMAPNSKIASQEIPNLSSYIADSKEFEVSVHAKWSGTDAHGYGSMQKHE